MFPRAARRQCHLQDCGGPLPSCTSTTNLFRHVLALTLLALTVASAWPQAEVPATGAGPIPTEQELQARLKRVEESATLTPEQKTRIAEVLNEALAALRSAREFENRAAQLKQLGEQAPAKIEEIKADLEEPLEEPSVPDLPLEALEQELAQQEASLRDVRTRLTELQNQLKNLPERKRQLGESLADARKQKAALAAEPFPQPSETEAAELTEARQALAQAKRLEVDRKIETYDLELQTADIREELLREEANQAARQENWAARYTALLRDAVNERRQTQAITAAREAARQEREAALEAVGAGPALREEVEELAGDTADLRQRTVTVLQKAERAAQEFREIEEKHINTLNDAESLENKVETVGLNPAIGLLLRRQRAALPDVASHRREIRLRENALASTQVAGFEVTEQRDSLDNVDEAVEQTLRAKGEGVEESEREAIAALLRRLYLSKREALDALSDAYGDYLDNLTELDGEQRDLVQTASELQMFIDQRVLWVRSGTPIKSRTALDLVESVREVATLRNARSVWRIYASDATSHPVAYSAGLLLLLAALGARPRAKRRIDSAGEQAVKNSCTSFRPTIEALIDTMFLAAWLPLLVWFAGWRLTASLESGEFARAAGQGLRAVALLLAAFTAVRHVFRPNGLAEAHFVWPPEPLKAIRRMAWAAGVLACTGTFALFTVASLANEAWTESLGRAFYLLLMLLLAAFSHRLLKKQSGPVWRVLSVTGAKGKHASELWHMVALSVPVVLALLAGAGFTYTAIELLKRLYLTVAVALLTGLVVRLIMRWILLARRRLAIKRARDRREQAKAAQAGETPPAAAPVAEPDYLTVIDTQTHRLLRVSALLALALILWGVWAEVLPALGMLERWELGWTYDKPVTVNGTEVIRQQPVTAANLMLALVIGVLGIVAARNIPGLLELVVLQRLRMGPGERYAVSAIVRYTIGATGIALFFGAIGIGWSKVQWIVAAMGLGLGFGLQEIFANFISGLIILFERPLRVGDTVTVGGTSGTVSKIRMRATTITDWDRKELVVPNKEFVTGQLVNWSLSDMVLRIIIPVGIAYGSDTELAVKELRRVASENPDVLEDPEPQVLFWAFGDSALNFELRVFVKSYTSYLETRHRLHMSVDQAFRAAGITIAFPQRDLHVRSIADALPIMDNRDKLED